MILNIKSEKSEITHHHILMNQVKTSIYGEPLIFIINIVAQKPLFEIEEEVTISLINNQKVKAYYHSSYHPVLQGQKSTSLIFTNIESVKIKYNKYPSETPVFGCKLNNAPRGTNLNDRLEWEMRKKGVIFTIKDFAIKTIPIDDGFNKNPKIIQDIESIQVLEDIKNRHNYLSVEPNKTPNYTTVGIDYPQFIPFLTKPEIKALDRIIHPSIQILSSNPNLDIDIGDSTTYHGEKYTIMSKIVSSLEQSYKVSFRLGKL